MDAIRNRARENTPLWERQGGDSRAVRGEPRTKEEQYAARPERKVEGEHLEGLKHETAKLEHRGDRGMKGSLAQPPLPKGSMHRERNFEDQMTPQEEKKRTKGKKR